MLVRFIGIGEGHEIGVTFEEALAESRHSASVSGGMGVRMSPEQLAAGRRALKMCTNRETAPVDGIENVLASSGCAR